MINGRSRLQGADVEIAKVTSKVKALSNQILINKEDIVAFSNNFAINYKTTNNMNMLLEQNYIPQAEKKKFCVTDLNVTRKFVAPSVGRNLMPNIDIDRALGSFRKRWLEINVDALNTMTILIPAAILPKDQSYLPPIPLTSFLEKEYQYVWNIESDEGCEVSYLSGDGGVIFSNVLVWPLTISLNLPKSKVTRYKIGPKPLTQHI